MPFDLLIRNATLPDGRKGQDIAIEAGRIVAVQPSLNGEAGRVIDAAGHLVSPPFVDIHFHMDATLSLGLPRLNVSGTLLEGIALWGELKPLLTYEALVERALRYCDLAVAQGLLAVRTHVDICDDRLLAVDALLDVKKQVAPYLDLELVAFPQDGYFRSPTAAQNLARALDKGVSIVGGIPHFERTMADGAASVKALCEIAAAYRDTGLRDAAIGPARSRRRLASDLDAFDGQLLRLETAAADRRGRRCGHRQPTDQYRAAGSP
jgi:cytosine/creatinine deaminase